ncbi:MAG: DUF3168 domain-containing protein [Dyella sp.]
MTPEGKLYALLAPLVGGRAYPDTTPDNPTFPLIVYQQVGGEAYAYADKSLPNHQHGRIQITTWSHTRVESRQLARSIEAAVIASALPAEAYGAFMGLYQVDLKLYGARQDFGIWFPDTA